MSLNINVSVKILSIVFIYNLALTCSYLAMLDLIQVWSSIAYIISSFLWWFQF